MTLYDFTFVLDREGLEENFEDRLFDAGCDDATVSLTKGVVFASFDREAQDYKLAVTSAYEQIKSAGFVVARFEPDYLVTQSEIAARCNMTRAAIGNFTAGDRREGFPPPTARIESKSPLWDWVAVSEWLYSQGKVGPDVLRNALVSRIINLGSQINHVSGTDTFDVLGQLEAA